jgi:Putative phage tail protein
MATLVLTAIGSALGGPIGGSIGAIIGQRIDQEIFKPKPRKGPRLTDLSLQTSTYGSDVPRLYGRMRVAGTVIWSTDLIEKKTKKSAKGQPSSIQYSYSASFAVALSARRIRSIQRIWADGTLLRGADGQFRTATTMRVHLGAADQPADPLMASALGMDRCPAHRDLAYVVFQDFALADYGNRIPSLTFEVEADDAAASPNIAAIIADICPALNSVAPAIPAGYAATGSTGAAAIAPMVDGWALNWCADRLAVAGPDRLLSRYAVPDDTGQALRTSLPSRHRQPHAITLRHYDPARDFQIGAQGARLSHHPDAETAYRNDQIEYPIALAADAASTLAQHRALRLLRSGQTADVALGPYAYDLRCGDVLDLGESGRWQIAAIEHGASGARVQLRLPVPPVLLTSSTPADPGQNLPSPAPDAGDTRLILADLPAALTGLTQSSGSPVQAGWHAAVAGTGASWRLAEVEMRAAPDAPLQSLGVATAATALGTAITALPPASALIEDQQSSVIIQLSGDHMDLADATPAQLYYGANLMLIGAEIVQFAHAEPLGNRRYRLSHLLRGRYGSETAISGHVAGEDVLLLDGSGLIPLGSAYSGAMVQAAAPSDASPVSDLIPRGSTALLPLSPVHPRWQWNGVTLKLGWVRRSRSGFDWLSGVDTPLGESVEAYRIIVTSSNGAVLMLDSGAEILLIDASALQPVVANSATSLNISVQHVGDYGLSAPLYFSIPTL